MNDLHDLKEALHSPPGFAAAPLDLTAIMRDGGRLRRRRRLGAGSAAAVAGVALLVGGHQLFAPDDPSPRTGAAQVPAAPSAAKPAPTVASTDPTDDAMGDVIRTGLPAKNGEWVLYATAIAEPSVPGITFGVMLGVRKKNGELESGVMSNETEGSGTAPGFHALEGSMVIDQGRTPAFGYYAGAVTKITTKCGSKSVTAQHAAWSENPQVVIFWFDPAKLSKGCLLQSATAYDRDGGKLPGGHSSFSVG
jgi:hypothetical protein